MPGEMICQEGETGLEMYFLLQGCAEAVLFAGRPNEKVVKTILPGEYFGEVRVSASWRILLSGAVI